jgi:glucose/arabinose dehydrogenase
LKRVIWFAGLWTGIALLTAAAAKPPEPRVSGLKNPASVAVGPDGKVYVTVTGEPGTADGGAVLRVEGDKAVPFAAGLEDPRGLVAWNQWLFVADKQRVWRIDRQGKAAVFAATEAFPSPPLSLHDITVDEQGALYVSDAGDPKGAGGAIYRISPRGRVERVADAQRTPALRTPTGLVMDGLSHLLVLDGGSGELLRIKLADGSATKLAEGFGGGHGLAWDWRGRLYIVARQGGRVFVIPRPGDKPILLAEGFQAPTDPCLDPAGKHLLVPDTKAGTLTALPAVVPGLEVDETPLPVETAVAFPDLQWTGWKPENEKGQIAPLRPLVLTHAGDGSNRVFVATQHGVVHVFPNDQKAAQTKVFLDIQDRVVYSDNQNEEGFLGLAFHPDYKKNGEFFVFYTTKKAKMTNVISRFRVRKDDPDRADPDSEEELFRVVRPFWNHDGGTLCFGPDGFLYVALGDGGSANDPFGNGQNLKTLLGKVLRIDVNRKDEGKNYAVPKDNPFVDKPEAKPEIWAYGLRNVWRMAFDRKTGKLWAADVGQNLYEEIDILERGGNYGWNVREGMHPFGAKGSGPRQDLIEPIWEYYHDVGKSLTGGAVYRGKRLPELEGRYVYADYVTAKIWALSYDFDKKRVVANRPLRDPNLPVFSFGEDEQGELYFLTSSTTGRGIRWFVRPTPQGKE